MKDHMNLYFETQIICMLVLILQVNLVDFPLFSSMHKTRKNTSAEH